MKWMQRTIQSVKPALLSAASWLALDAAALAQAQQPSAEPQGGSYVLSYFLVLLAVGLGLLVVCRASHRRDRAKPEQYDEAKVNLNE